MQKLPPLLSGEQDRLQTAPSRQRPTQLLSAVLRGLFLGGTMVVLVCSCSKPPESATSASPSPNAAPTPEPTPTPKPTPTPLPTPTPIVRHFAPEGIFYLTEEATARGPGFLAGVPPGTQVKKVKEKGDLTTVSDGQHEFDVKTNQLTNDLDELAKIVKSQRSTEQASEAFRAQQEAILQKQQRDQIEYLNAHPLGTPAPTSTPRR